MKNFRTDFLPVLLATLWISLSEFLRNQILFKTFWTDHYQALGIPFPAEPINGAVWGIWSLMLAIVIFYLSRRYTLAGTTILAWFAAFPMMWVVIGNLSVLPYGILVYAIPLSLLEVFLAALIIVRMSRAGGAGS